MSRRFVFMVAVLSTSVWAAPGAGQDTESASSPPPDSAAGLSQTSSQTEPSSQTSQPQRPAAPRDPLLSPATLMTEFLRAIGEVEKKPERMKDAVRCLDLSLLSQADPSEAEREGPLLAGQLGQIIDALLNTYGKSLDEIPTEPDGDTVVFPAEGEVQLVLARSADGLWRFAAATVAAIPEKFEAVNEKKQQQEQQAPQREVAAVPAGFRTARATMRTFLEAMAEGDAAKAAECLDLSELPAATRAEIGSALAEKLLFVMDRIEVVVYQKISDQPGAEPYLWHMDEHGRIELARQDSGEQEGRWLFTATTVHSIDPLFKAFEAKPRVEGLAGPSLRTSPRRWLLEKIPPRWKGELLQVQLWQWVGLAVLLVLGYAAHRGGCFILSALIRPLGRSKHIELPEAHLAASVRPLGMMVMLVTWWVGLWLLLIPTAVVAYLLPALKFVLTVVGVWAAYRIIDLVTEYFASRARLTATRLDDALVPLARKTAKIIVVAVGLVCILEAVGATEKTVTRLVAGLGLGGLAFALAAQDSLKNFFGSVTVILDRPFQVGDWVKIGSEVEGTVESVGLRSSRIRTFYNSEITVPNSEIMNAIVDNMGRRRYRRIRCKLSVTYATTPEQLEAFCEGIRELIRRHPYTRKDYYLAWVNEFAASSINILLYCFHETPDWVTELRERHRLFLDIIRLARRLGIEFAFPTQTIHLAREAGDGRPAPAAPAAPLLEGKTTTEQAITLGRDEAAKLAEQTVAQAGGIPRRFEFPKV